MSDSAAVPVAVQNGVLLAVVLVASLIAVGLYLGNRKR